MTDIATRNLERASKVGDAEAQVRLVRAHVRNGLTLSEGQRLVYGVAQGDVYTWTHPETRTVHAFRVKSHYYAQCGTGVVRESYYIPLGAVSMLSYRVIRGWRPLHEVTCKRCLRGLHPGSHSALKGTVRWGVTIPDWAPFST